MVLKICMKFAYVLVLNESRGPVSDTERKQKRWCLGKTGVVLSAEAFAIAAFACKFGTLYPFFYSKLFRLKLIARA